MNVADTLRVDTDALATHAKRVEQLADDVSTARQAAASVNVSGGAFGLMCSFLVPPACMVTAAASALLGSADSMMRRTSEALTLASQSFDAADDGVEQGMRRLGDREFGPR